MSKTSTIEDEMKEWGKELKSQKTLRDEFAMAALTGLIIRQEWSMEGDVKTAYEYADAMMEARRK